MKKLVAVVFALFLIVSFSSVYAHPPSDITITFDPATKMLTAVIMHGVSNPETHFIKKVDVALNGKEVIEEAISRQDNTLSQTVSFLIPDGKPGDTLSVEGYCNLSGKLEKEIKI